MKKDVLIEDDYVGFQLKLPEGKEYFKTQEVADILCVSDQYIRNCIVGGKIIALAVKDKKKTLMRIPRSSLLFYVNKASTCRRKNFLEEMREFLKHRTEEDLVSLKQIINEILEDI